MAKSSHREVEQAREVHAEELIERALFKTDRRQYMKSNYSALSSGTSSSAR